MSKRKRKITFSDIEAGRANAPEVADQDIDPNDVMPVQCASCPWRSDANRLELSPEQRIGLTLQVTTEANQRCHAPALNGQAETKICRGARDYQIQIFHRLGVLAEPTDECWRETLDQARSMRDR